MIFEKSEFLFIILLLVNFYNIFGCNEETKIKKNIKTSENFANQSDFNLTEAMRNCNKTFFIEIEFWDEFQETGTIPDESDKSALCFMRCILEKMNIITIDNDFHVQQAMEIFKISNETAIDCFNETTKTNFPTPCEYSYNLIRCIYTRLVVDGRSKTDN